MCSPVMHVIISYIRHGGPVNGVIDAYIHDRVMLERDERSGHRFAEENRAPDQSRPIARSPRHAGRNAVRPPKPYHHGDLRRALDRRGAAAGRRGRAEAVSVREAARRAGVSPGAPFRHFRKPRRADDGGGGGGAAALSGRDRERRWPTRPPAIRLSRFRSLGLAYLRWAMHNPAHFEIISSGRYFDHDGAAELSRDNAELIAMTERTAGRGLRAGASSATPTSRPVQIAGRALVYGFARMNIDGHFPRWGVAGKRHRADRGGGRSISSSTGSPSGPGA